MRRFPYISLSLFRIVLSRSSSSLSSMLQLLQKAGVHLLGTIKGGIYFLWPPPSPIIFKLAESMLLAANSSIPSSIILMIFHPAEGM